MAIRDADIKLLFGKNVTVGESINENIANPSQFGAVDKVSQQPSRYVIMRKTT